MDSGQVIAEIARRKALEDVRMVGEVVHQAAKIEKYAEPGQVILTQSTLSLVEDVVKVERRRNIMISDNSKSIETFILKGISLKKRKGFRGVEKNINEIVGRMREIEFLSSILRGIGNSNGAMVMLVGDAGIGKSRIINEFQHIMKRYEVRFFEFDQVPFGLSTHDDVLGNIARSIYASSDCRNSNEVAAEALSRLRARIEPSQYTIAAVTELFGGTPDAPYWRDLSLGEKLLAKIRALTDLLVLESFSSPLALIFEDCHWAKTEIMFLLKEISEKIENSNLLVIMSSRPMAAYPWGDISHIKELKIEPLSSKDVKSLVNALMGHHESLVIIKEKIISQTQGNPFFIIECVRALNSMGAIGGYIGGYYLSDKDIEICIPATVHGVLAAHIDTLSELHRNILLTASVIGQTFDVALLDEIMEVPLIHHHLDQMIQSGFVEQTRVIPNLEFSFKHALIHQVAYETILKQTRRLVHAKIVRKLYTLRHIPTPRKIELLAHHAFRAERWREAYVFGRRAGLRAKRGSRFSEAADLLTNALTALERLESNDKTVSKRINIRLDIAEALLPLGQKDKLNNYIESVKSLCGVTTNKKDIFRVASNKTFFIWGYGKIDDAIVSAQSALSIAKELQDKSREIQVLARLGSLFFERGDFHKANKILKQALHKIKPQDKNKFFGLAVVAAVGCKTFLGRSLAEIGEFRKAILYAEDAINQADCSNHTFTKIISYNNIGHILLTGGYYLESIEYFQVCATLCEEVRASLVYPFAVGGLGYARFCLGKHEEGLMLLEHALAYAHREKLISRVPVISSWYSDVQSHFGRFDAAHRELVNALSMAKGNGDTPNQGKVLFSFGKFFRSKGADYKEVAMNYFVESKKIAKSCGMKLLALQCDVEIFHLRNFNAKDKILQEVLSDFSDRAALMGVNINYNIETRKLLSYSDS